MAYNFKFYKRIKQPIPNIRELLNKIDENTWKLYEDGMTSTLNQADTEISTSMLKNINQNRCRNECFCSCN